MASTAIATWAVHPDQPGYDDAKAAGCPLHLLASVSTFVSGPLSGSATLAVRTVARVDGVRRVLGEDAIAIDTDAEISVPLEVDHAIPVGTPADGLTTEIALALDLQCISAEGAVVSWAVVVDPHLPPHVSWRHCD